ncbi:hypothetical protein BV898_07994 [Hypsibius exemplaris]|uniref:Major facilitator superfamily associated domain-containing protein n=1 Tax=Hypsibius exemplaris TaxID=2072580 RepID=A0A1W0WRT6_HYPEX|nr:hypothetical protein BV898_07994 [Hypsibius exemplaris]
MNGPQTVMVNWVREVNCTRLGGIFCWSDFNITCSDQLNFNETSPFLVMWCKAYSEDEEDNIILENPELNTFWAISSSFLNVGGFVSSLFCKALANCFGLKGALYLLSGIYCCGVLTVV